MKKFTPVQYWQVALGASVLSSMVIAGLIWFSGTPETESALHNGQRLIITLETGAIEGAQAPASTQTEKEGKAPESTPAPEATKATAEVNPLEKPPEKPLEKPMEKPVEKPVEKPPATIPAPTPEKTSALTPEPENLAPIDAEKITGNSLAPVKDVLTEKSQDGLLPVISNGVRPWRYYGRPFVHKGNLPMIAIVVTGLGQTKSVSDIAIRLPVNVTLSFSPYAKELGTWINAARVIGHEVLVDLPVEASNFPASDPGPYGLLAGSAKEINAKKLDWLMSRAQGYIGFLTPQNDVFTINNDAFKSVIGLLDKRGLMLLMGHEPAKTETSELLTSGKIPYGVADLLVDEDLSNNAIQTRLTTLEKLAKKRGYAIGIAQPLPLTLQQLTEWSDHLEKDGFELVPVSFLVGLKFPK